jgi:hypothetical protein
MGSGLVLRVTARRQTVAELAEFLRFLDRPVVDASGLTGPTTSRSSSLQRTYAGRTEHRWRRRRARAIRTARRFTRRFRTNSASGWDPRRVPFDVLVIDHIDRAPNGNK